MVSRGPELSGLGRELEGRGKRTLWREGVVRRGAERHSAEESAPQLRRRALPKGLEQIIQKRGHPALTKSTLIKGTFGRKRITSSINQNNKKTNVSRSECFIISCTNHLESQEHLGITLGITLDSPLETMNHD